MPTAAPTRDAGWLHTLTTHPAAAIDWRDPGPPTRHERLPDTTTTVPLPDGRHGAWLATQLQARTRTWAAIFSGRAADAYTLHRWISRGHRGFTYHGHYQATTRIEPDGTGHRHITVFARHVGADPTPGGQ